MNKYNVELLKDETDPTFLFFWGHTPNKNGKLSKECLSQWYPSPIKFGEVTYSDGEQYMMAKKALLFQDNSIYLDIMNAKHPSEYKALGRKIRKFDQKVWDDQKNEIVFHGNYLKFTQNTHLADYLLTLDGCTIVEASPYDRVWGVGLDASDKRILDPNTWRGENLLGFILMEVRDCIKSHRYTISKREQ